MTVGEKLITILVSCGMFESQAKEVLELAKPVLNQDNYHITFNAPETDYPKTVYNLWFEMMKPVALKWIDENKPKAWFRPMFLPEQK